MCYYSELKFTDRLKEELSPESLDYWQASITQHLADLQEILQKIQARKAWIAEQNFYEEIALKKEYTYREKKVEYYWHLRRILQADPRQAYVPNDGAPKVAGRADHAGRKELFRRCRDRARERGCMVRTNFLMPNADLEIFEEITVIME